MHLHYDADVKNIYRKQDEVMWQKLHDFVISSKYIYAQRLNAGKCLELSDFIANCIPDELHGVKLSLKTKIYMIFAGMTDFPRCHECGKLILKQVKDIKLGFKHHKDQKFLFCSAKCKNANEDYQHMAKATQKKLHEDVTFEKHKLEKTRTTLLKQHGSLSYPAQRAKEAIKKKYGVNNVSQLPEVKRRCIQTLREHFNDPSICNSFQTEEVKEKCKRTMLAKHGVEYASQNPESKQKAMKTMIEHYGTVACKRRYAYDWQKFDSSWELCYYIWLKDTSVNFVYPCKEALAYYCDGKQHLYFPDFIVEGRYVEIKGKQFLNESKHLTNPFKNVDEKLKVQLEHIAEAKQRCIEQNEVKLLSEDDLKECFAYVEKKFGVKHFMDFCKHCKIQKKSKQQIR